MSIQPITTTTTHTANRRWLAGVHGTELNQPATLDLTRFTEGLHWVRGSGVSQPYCTIKSGIPLGRLNESGLYAPYSPPTSETQTVTITGGPTGGTYTLTYNAQTTAAIAYNATPAQVQAALEALNNIAVGDVKVTGAAGGPYTVAFVGHFLGVNVPQMTANAGGLTGGTTPAVNVTTPTGGGTATASDGTEVLAGFLEADVPFNPGASKAVVALRVHGQVDVSKLPVPGFIPPAPGSTTALIHYIGI
ncbi:hypothetical protein [Kitasatospora sp. NPDC087315]|uniref:hypothetical protein n=1 Tax=Kitasatospora sp. NPDC087315 TaxID=3364069 RepID=UPI0037F9C597